MVPCCGFCLGGLLCKATGYQSHTPSIEPSFGPQVTPKRASDPRKPLSFVEILDTDCGPFLDLRAEKVRRNLEEPEVFDEDSSVGPKGMTRIRTPKQESYVRRGQRETYLSKLFQTVQLRPRFIPV